MYLLTVKGLTVKEVTTSALVLKNIHLKIIKNKISALIGESGAGKSLLVQSIAGLLPNNLFIVSGEFYFSGENISYCRLKNLRGRKILYTPQNATSSLNPMVKIRKQVDETSRVGLKRIENILFNLDFSDPTKILNSYTFELSEGENQRCLLAMAIAINPDFLILDEPTLSLDSSTQKDFITLLQKVQEKYCMTILVITHNLFLLKKISDYIYIIKDGVIVDKGKKSSIFLNPSHEYTKELARFF
jgi:peptide/nickel transport system ATP-binding protein